MPAQAAGTDSACPYCGWPDSAPATVLSSHRTAEGVVRYLRCACGSLSVRITPWGAGPERADRVVTRSVGGYTAARQGQPGWRRGRWPR